MYYYIYAILCRECYYIHCILAQGIGSPPYNIYNHLIMDKESKCLQLPSRKPASQMSCFMFQLIEYKQSQSACGLAWVGVTS